MKQEIFTFFWSGPFSQWHPSPFVIDGKTFQFAETYMMWAKDQLFGGTLEAQILAANNPAVVKDLGRQVPNFDKAKWEALARPIVFRGSMAKFTQNPTLLEFLMETDGTTLVEASPKDTIWGIGLAADNPLALDRRTWKGTNWLGETLTEVRDTLTLARIGFRTL